MQLLSLLPDLRGGRGGCNEKEGREGGVGKKGWRRGRVENELNRANVLTLMPESLPSGSTYSNFCSILRSLMWSRASSITRSEP